MIEIKNLKKSFSKHDVLNGVDLRFDAGHVYGLMGHNGAGKTTLFNCLAGMESFDGEIKSDWPDLKNQLGYLMADLYFFPLLTGREYLQLCTSARNKFGINFDERNIFDLPLDQYARTYSTGMKKKLALLAVLLQDNSVFILDEPFNGLDLQSNMLVTAIIQELKNLGKTVILSSHIFSTLTESCDQIILLEGGRCNRRFERPEFNVLNQELEEYLPVHQIRKLSLK